MAQHLSLGGIQVFDTSISSLNQALRQIQMALGMSGVVQVFDQSTASLNLALAQVQQRLDALHGLQGRTLGPIEVGELTVSSVNQALLQIVVRG